MNRRDFIAGLASIGACPIAARSQQSTIPVIGYLSSGSLDSDGDRIRAFHDSLREAGYFEGRNVLVEYRWAEGIYDRLPGLVTDLVRRRVTIIVCDAGVPGALAAKAATTTIPIVFLTGVDPVAFGLVSSLARPGGNLTGVTSLADEVGPKRLQLMHEVIPTASKMALLVNPANPNSQSQSRDMEAAARALKLQLLVLHASSDHELDSVFASIFRLGAAALVVGPDTFWRSGSRIEKLASLAARHAFPAIYEGRNFVVAGGLMSYGTGSRTDKARLVGSYAGRILKGEKPGDLPVQQATKTELFTNLRTAKTLGLTIPETLLATADEVIQ